MPASSPSILKVWLNRFLAQVSRILPSSEGVAQGSGGGITVFLLPAHNGDAVLIEFHGNDGKPHFIWIDGGLVRSYHEELKDILQEFVRNGELIDLMIVTHIDADHIGGILAFVNDQDLPKDFVKQFWFNAGRTLDNQFGGQRKSSRDIDLQSIGIGSRSRSVSQGEKLEDFLTRHGGWHDIPIQAGQEFTLYGARLILLSPNETSLRQLHKKWELEGDQAQTRQIAVSSQKSSATLEELARLPEKEDHAIPNGSSIAFIFESNQRRVLFLGDAHPSVIVSELEKLEVSSRKPLHLSGVKLSHHASQKSISNDLLSMIRCQNYMVLTDGSRYGLPDRETFAKILLHPKRKRSEQMRFVFNYSNQHLRDLFTEEEKKSHNFDCVYPANGEKGIWLEL
ncbi:MAG: hypothetical protein AAF587_31855 [Bacteroidota bacterium]